MMKLQKFCVGLLVAGVSGYAQATVYNITGVLSGTDETFRFSQFHDATDLDGDADPSTGSQLSKILTTGFSGTYDDQSGAFNAVFDLENNVADSVTMTGNLLFVGGLLSSESELAIDFSGSYGQLVDTVMGFNPGDVCCESTADPNSFDGSLMSLWGANFNYSGGPNGPISLPGGFNGSYDGSTLGMDLRIELTAIPVPASAWLFASGILGLATVMRRKR